jgi:hypothetical protein
MCDALNFAEMDGLSVQLLPARTVLSLFNAGTHGGDNAGNGGVSNALFNMMSDALGHQIDSAGTGVGGAGGSADAGRSG